MNRQGLAIAVLALTACTTTPAYVTTEPPRVNCELGPTRQVEAAPIRTDGEWLTQGKAWALDVLGVLTEERALRGLEHDCLQKHRNAGAIR